MRKSSDCAEELRHPVLVVGFPRPVLVLKPEQEETGSKKDYSAGEAKSGMMMNGADILASADLGDLIGEVQVSCRYTVHEAAWHGGTQERTFRHGRAAGVCCRQLAGATASRSAGLPASSRLPALRYMPP